LRHQRRAVLQRYREKQEDLRGDEMVAAMDKVGVDGAIFISAFFDVPGMTRLCGGDATGPSRSVRYRQARQPGSACAKAYGWSPKKA